MTQRFNCSPYPHPLTQGGFTSTQSRFSPSPAQGPIILPTQNSKSQTASLTGSQPILNEPIDVNRTDAAFAIPLQYVASPPFPQQFTSIPTPSNFHLPPPENSTLPPSQFPFLPFQPSFLKLFPTWLFYFFQILMDQSNL